MKRLSALILCVLLAALLVVPASAGTKEFEAEYFPGGKPETPTQLPFFGVRETNEDGDPIPTEINIYLPVTSDILRLGEDMERGVDLGSEYNINYCDVFAQLDVKFDDGKWLSSEGNWDRFEYADEYGGGDSQLVFEIPINCDGAGDEPLLNIEQVRLAYHDEDNFVSPYVHAVKNAGGETVWQYRLDEHTMTYRYRFFIRYAEIDGGGEIISFSDWSPETSIGKNGTSVDPTAVPTEAPVLSDFSLEVDSNRETHAHYYMLLPDSVMQNIVYYDIFKGEWEFYSIETQVRVNGGDWQDVESDHYWSVSSGYRHVNEAGLYSVDDAVELRVRLTTDTEVGDSPWSNIVGNNAKTGDKLPTEGKDEKQKAKKPAPAEEEPEETKSTCKLCHICPVQPLGICLFVWIAAILLVIILIAVLSKKSKKKKEERR